MTLARETYTSSRGLYSSSGTCQNPKFVSKILERHSFARKQNNITGAVHGQNRTKKKRKYNQAPEIISENAFAEEATSSIIRQSLNDVFQRFTQMPLNHP